MSPSPSSCSSRGWVDPALRDRCLGWPAKGSGATVASDAGRGHPTASAVGDTLPVATYPRADGWLRRGHGPELVRASRPQAGHRGQLLATVDAADQPPARDAVLLQAQGAAPRDRRLRAVCRVHRAPGAAATVGVACRVADCRSCSGRRSKPDARCRSSSACRGNAGSGADSASDGILVSSAYFRPKALMRRSSPQRGSTRLHQPSKSTPRAGPRAWSPPRPRAASMSATVLEVAAVPRSAWMVSWACSMPSRSQASRRPGRPVRRHRRRLRRQSPRRAHRRRRAGRARGGARRLGGRSGRRARCARGARPGGGLRRRDAGDARGRLFVPRRAPAARSRQDCCNGGGEGARHRARGYQRAQRGPRTRVARRVSSGHAVVE